MSFIIRKEKPVDIQSIYKVTVDAFLDAPHADHSEQFIVEALRKSGALTVSLVAEKSAHIIGHVALSPVTISDGSSDWYGLGPLSVSPDEQGKGIGSKLMGEALEELRNINASGCVLLGDPNYYHRFGFEPIDAMVLAGVPAEYFQVLLFQGAHPKGTVTYNDSFSAQS